MSEATCHGCLRPIPDEELQRRAFIIEGDVVSISWCAECGKLTEEDVKHRWGKPCSDDSSAG